MTKLKGQHCQRDRIIIKKHNPRLDKALQGSKNMTENEIWLVKWSKNAD